MCHEIKSIILLVALAFCAYCCSPKGDDSVTMVSVGDSKMALVSLNKLNSNEAKVPLSSLVENCELVQLETNDNAFFRLGSTTVTEKYIGIRSSGAPFKLFSRSGKFIGNIGAIGQGPGEWQITLYDDIIDDENELIYLAPFAHDEKIRVYSTSGQYLKDIVAPERLNKPRIFLSDNVLTVVHLPFEGTKSLVYQFDVNTGELLNELPPPAHLFMIPTFDHEMFSARNVAGFMDFQFFNIVTNNDTLYHFDIAKHNILSFYNVAFSASENLWSQHFILNKDLFLTNLRCMTWKGDCTKTGLVATDLKHKTSSWIEIVNDYYGNLPVTPFGFNQFLNGYFVHNIQPEELLEKIENHLSERGLSENDRQILNKTLSTLKENTNNVVFIGKLKSEIKTKLW